MNLVALARADRANVVRDPMLLAASVAGLPLALLVRFGLGPLTALASPWAGPDLVRALVGSLLLVLPSVLTGTVCAFLIVEERDEQVLRAVAVTPAGVGGLLRWRIAAATSLALAAPVITWTVAGLPWQRTLPLCALAAALHAPLVVSLMVRLARDKVQALAWSKATSPLAVAGASLLLPGQAAWLGAPLPAFWIARALWTGSFVEAGLGVGVVVAATLCLGPPRP